MYNSQLNLWIRVASLNKGRWRHKMAVLLGKVRKLVSSHMFLSLFVYEAVGPSVTSV